MPEKPAEKESEKVADKSDKKDDEAKEADKPKQPALFAVNYPLGDFGRAAPEQPKAVVFRHATVWTCGPQGGSKTPTCWSRRARSRRSAASMDVPDGAHGRQRRRASTSTPGIIDCHSHIATDGGVNEIGPDDHGRSSRRRFYRSQRHQYLSPIGRRCHQLEHPARLGQHDRRTEPGAQVPLGAGA